MYRLIVLWILLLPPIALGEWKRYVYMDWRVGVDPAPVRDLAYFQVDPCLRNPKDYLLQCDTQPTPEAMEHMRKARTNLRLVGKVGAFSAYDLEYFLSDEGKWPEMRSVLMETGPDQ